MIIIGGGPAGAVAGHHLARAGFGVTIIERSAFPRVKVCGEFISPAATRLLEQVVGTESLRTAGARRVGRFVLELDDRQWAWEMPEPAWALSRASLDALLMERAQRAGASVLQPASVRAVEYRDRGVRVFLSDGRSAEGDLVIHADGSGRHDPAGPVPCDRNLIGHKCHLRVPRSLIDGVRIRIGSGAYVGTIAVEGESATCALTAGRALVERHRGDLDAMLKGLWPDFDPRWRSSEWKSCSIPRSTYVEPGHVRSFRIGNAAAAVDPIGGEGIGLAIWSGTRLAELLADTTTRRGIVPLRRAFAREYSRRLRARLPACRLAAAVLSRPGLCRTLWPILAAPRVSVAPWYALTGKARGAGTS